MRKVRIFASKYIGGFLGNAIGALIFVVWMLRHHDAVDCFTRLDSIMDENEVQVDKMVILIGLASTLIVYGFFGITTAIIFAIVNAVLNIIKIKKRES